MPQSLANINEHEEIAVANQKASSRRDSLQHYIPRLSNEKASLVVERKTSKHGKPVNRNDADRYAAKAEKASTGSSIPTAQIFGSKNIRENEVVKYMSSIPGYLEKGECTQDNVLNFGVLDWRHLEKWRSRQEKVSNSRSRDSPCSINSSAATSCSTFGSTSQSTRSIGSPSAQRKQSSEVNAHRNSSTEGRQTQPTKEKMSVQNIGHPNSNFTDSRPAEKGKMKPQPPDVGSSSSSLEVNDSPAFVFTRVKPQIGRSREEEKFHNHEEQSYAHNSCFGRDRQQDQCTKVEGALDRQGSAQARYSSSGTAASNRRRSIEASILGKVPLTRHSEELSTSGRKTAAATRGELSPDHLLNAGVKRCSSLRESSSGELMKQSMPLGNPHEDNGTSSSRNYSSITPQRLISPLRRILDPLLKLKNQVRLSGPSTILTSHQAQAVTSGDKRSTMGESSIVNSLPSKDPEVGGSVPAQNQAMSTGQALLKLVWKNERPLFVFSVNDSSVLAATIGKRSMSLENDFSCTYMIFTAHELKRKGVVWMGQGANTKKHELAYNLIARMAVSSSKDTVNDSEDYFIIRNFVLFGTEVSLSNHGSIHSSFESELAAIVIQVPSEKFKDSDVQSDNSRYLLCTDQKDKALGQASVVAILPTAIHGTSSMGEPTPLIERWKSGGCCDCGGWDEGCKLTVLTEKIQEGTKPALSEALSAGVNHRVELFPQGEDREKKHSFRLVAFEEGVYKVEFGSSVALVQAFAMSIAILHSKKPHTPSGLYYSMRAQSIRER